MPLLPALPRDANYCPVPVLHVSTAEGYKPCVGLAVGDVAYVLGVVESPSHYGSISLDLDVNITTPVVFNQKTHSILVDNKGPGEVQVRFQSETNNVRALQSNEAFSIDLKVDRLFLKAISVASKVIIDYTFF